MALVGCYSLDLYCDTGGEIYGSKCPHRPLGLNEPGNFTGQTEGECIKDARRLGWTFNRNRTEAYCPKCSARSGH